jgi:hypothetical protein
MYVGRIGFSCVLALICITNAFGASVHNHIDLGSPAFNTLTVSSDKKIDNLLVGVAHEILHKGPKYNLQMFDEKIAFEDEKRFCEHIKKIERHESHVGNTAAPTSSAIILFGSAIIGLVVVGRRLPETNQGDAPA